jgi:hypothetical protein
MKNDSIAKHEYLIKSTRLLDEQERIIGELRQFIEESLTPILAFIE